MFSRKGWLATYALDCFGHLGIVSFFEARSSTASLEHVAPPEYLHICYVSLHCHVLLLDKSAWMFTTNPVIHGCSSYHRNVAKDRGLAVSCGGAPLSCALCILASGDWNVGADVNESCHSGAKWHRFVTHGLYI
mmetsp:Transcript_87706/g.146256  ORF Transcript_87706/g.146256 Transcript_87706/m.146256 type:complete len:134 (-) Transcript_87706:47-448(-)